MMQIRGLGVTAPYMGLLIARLLFVLLLPLMPETLPARSSADLDCEDTRSSSEEADAKPAALVSQFLAAPMALLQPFRVLVPKQVDGRRSYQLSLIAASYALLMIVPGLVSPRVLPVQTCVVTSSVLGIVRGPLRSFTAEATSAGVPSKLGASSRTRAHSRSLSFWV